MVGRERPAEFGDAVETDEHRVATGRDARGRERFVADVQRNRCGLELPRRAGRQHEVILAEYQARSPLQRRLQLVGHRLRNGRRQLGRAQHELCGGDVFHPLGVGQPRRQLRTVVAVVVDAQQCDAALRPFEIHVDVSQDRVLGLLMAAILFQNRCADKVRLPRIGRVFEGLLRRFGRTRLTEERLNERSIGETRRQHFILPEVAVTECRQLLIGFSGREELSHRLLRPRHVVVVRRIALHE